MDAGPSSARRRLALTARARSAAQGSRNSYRLRALLTGDDGRYYIGHLQKRTYKIVVRKELNSDVDLFSTRINVPTNGDYDIPLPK
jgi:hypothetical protein